MKKIIILALVIFASAFSPNANADKAAECKANIQKVPGNHQACNPIACEALVEGHYARQFALCIGPYEHMKVNGVCPFTNTTPIPIVQKNCFCCSAGARNPGQKR